MQKNMSENAKSTKLNIPKIMLGTFNVPDYEQMENLVVSSLKNGCYAFDTSPSYGTEKNLGKALAENKNLYNDREKIFLSTKIDAIQMYKTDGKIEKYVEESLRNLQVDYIDLLLIHWPFETYMEKTWETMEKLYKEGIVKSIGICNLNQRVLNKFMDAGIFKEVLPQVVQNEISPLRTCSEEIEYYKSKGLEIQAYSPLARMLKPVKESETLKMLAQKYNKDIGQIILRWHVDRGITPIFTSTKPSRIQSNLNIFDFSLEERDIQLINDMNQNYKIFLESYGCPGI